MMDDEPEVVAAAPRTGRRPRLFRPQVLPTMLTLGNLFCGYLAIAKAADALAIPRVKGMGFPEEGVHLLWVAGWLLFAGMVFDALDGSVARISGGASALGNVLDSLADLVSFGVAPAFLAKCLAEGVGGMQDRRVSLYFSVFFALMAALRLARYSSHHGDPEEANLWFEGLPTPGAAGVIGILAILVTDPDWRPEAWMLRWLPLVTLLLGLLMVSKLPYAHVTNRFLRGRKPVTYLVIAILVLLLSMAWKVEVVLAGALFGYALSGPVVALLRRRDPAASRGPGGGGA